MNDLATELARRQALPQRHRLLQGYPMMPLHRRAAPDRAHERSLDGRLVRLATRGEPEVELEPAWVALDATRPLIVGVLPHMQCNPKVKGCGFCTFPHDSYSKRTLLDTVDAVEREMWDVVTAHPSLAKRKVDAVYFGGATANLTPRKALVSLGTALARAFDVTQAEMTLEGVPSLFRSLLPGPFDALLEMPARQRRVSMGVQTFDPAWIERMGRRGLGDARTVAQVVDKAHRHGMTASGDFLVNLPGQSTEAMLRDMRDADAAGLDQICVYPLVLGAETGAEWSKDSTMLAALPQTDAARDRWLAVRDALLSQGFVQTTLTNFERRDVQASERRFVYETCSFRPDAYDALGFGPTAISTFVDLPARRALKLVRGKLPRERSAGDLYFPYGEEDLRLLHLTRTFARLVVSRKVYRDLFGADVTAHFGAALRALGDAGLVSLDDDALRLTPNGMFFADSVVGLLAWERSAALREAGAGIHTRELLEPRTMPVLFMG